MRKLVCAITPNPALDLSGIVKSMKPNEKSYVHNEGRRPGGNAINAARILKRLKTPVIASGFLGGSTGDEIESLIDQENVAHHFVSIQSVTRINVTVSNRSTHQQTRLSFPGPKIRKSEKQQLFDFFERQGNIAFLLIGGSLPPGFEAADLIHLMKLAQKRNIESVVDCPGNILAQIISAKPLLIKPNLEEFQELTGSRATTIGSVIQKAHQLLEQIPFVCVSSVEEGTLLLTRQGHYFGRIPRIKIHSTVGAGDSMVGAMVAQLYISNSSSEDILKWGLAAAAATLAEAGTSLGQVQEIIRLYKKTRVEILKV